MQSVFFSTGATLLIIIRSRCSDPSPSRRCCWQDIVAACAPECGGGAAATDGRSGSAAHASHHASLAIGNRDRETRRARCEPDDSRRRCSSTGSREWCSLCSGRCSCSGRSPCLVCGANRDRRVDSRLAVTVNGQSHHASRPTTPGSQRCDLLVGLSLFGVTLMSPWYQVLALWILGGSCPRCSSRSSCIRDGERLHLWYSLL